MNTHKTSNLRFYEDKNNIMAYSYLEKKNGFVLALINKAEMFDVLIKIKNIGLGIFSVILLIVLLNMVRDEELGQISTIFAKMAGHNLDKIKEQEEAERKRKEAEAATKAKSQFLAHMSHEIRTPMNAIIGLSCLALKTELTPKQEDYLKKISNSAQLLLGIINDILDFSKIEAGKLEIEQIDFFLDDVLSNVSNLITMKAEEKGLQLLFNINSDVPYALIGDPLRLGQVLINLSNNAVKFTQKGKIIIKIEQLNNDNNKILLKFSVEDTGIGLTQEQISKLFQSFSQADNSTTRKFGGTGLGLAISKHLVEIMNGEINVLSEYGKGTIFSFTAQFGLQKDIKERKKDKSDEEIQKLIENIRGAKILLVEDLKINQQVATEILEDQGFKVIIANNGLEAIDMLNKNSDLIFDIVLMDIQMPEMDGYEATQKIRCDCRFNDLPIIAMTANAIIEEKEKCIEIGMNDHVSKPIEPKALFSVLIKWIKPGKRNICEPSIKIEKKVPIVSEDLPAINMKLGLRRLAGNTNLLMKMFDIFYESHQSTGELLKNALNDIDYKTIRRIAHNIKSTAGSIGAEKLSILSGDLEFAALKEDSIDISKLVEKHVEYLQEVLVCIKKIKDPKKDEKIDKTQNEDNFSCNNIDEITILFNELNLLLESGRIEAKDTVKLIREKIKTKQIENDLNQLEKYIYEYEFENAIKILSKIRDDLNERN
ncbi:MAG: response regulator [Desulfobacterales bacterium]|nr:response regulator [Desulfobacterales bacterium]